jgi:hypothetical protein
MKTSFRDIAGRHYEGSRLPVRLRPYALYSREWLAVKRWHIIVTAAAVTAIAGVGWKISQTDFSSHPHEQPTPAVSWRDPSTPADSETTAMDGSVSPSDMPTLILTPTSEVAN